MVKGKLDNPLARSTKQVPNMDDKELPEPVIEDMVDTDEDMEADDTDEPVDIQDPDEAIAALVTLVEDLHAMLEDLAHIARFLTRGSTVPPSTLWE